MKCELCGSSIKKEDKAKYLEKLKEFMVELMNTVFS